MMEALRGIKAIKCCAWEPLFARKVRPTAAGSACTDLCRGKGGRAISPLCRHCLARMPAGGLRAER